MTIHKQIQELREQLWRSDETTRLMSAGFVDRADVECILEGYEDRGYKMNFTAADFDMDDLARDFNNALMETWNEILEIVIDCHIDFNDNFTKEDSDES